MINSPLAKVFCLLGTTGAVVLGGLTHWILAGPAEAPAGAPPVADSVPHDRVEDDRGRTGVMEQLGRLREQVHQLELHRSEQRPAAPEAPPTRGCESQAELLGELRLELARVREELSELRHSMLHAPPSARDISELREALRDNQEIHLSAIEELGDEWQHSAIDAVRSLQLTYAADVVERFGRPTDIRVEAGQQVEWVYTTPRTRLVLELHDGFVTRVRVRRDG